MEPTLVILAAGMGSRFGGLKQITAVDEMGHAIIDYSMFDAYRAGFRKVCFIIKHEIEDDFKVSVGKRMEKVFDVQYVYQQLDCLPEGYSVPEGRVKPWGTAHAVLCCAGTVEGPFAVINADDFYGPGAFSALYDFLKNDTNDREQCMVAYQLRNTVTEHGHVARGHVAAIDYMQTHKGENVFNLGTGIGYSVLDMVHAFERVTGKKIPYEITARRPGDLATVYASPDKSAELLGWKAQYNLDDMCRDTWAWQTKNPMGYGE